MTPSVHVRFANETDWSTVAGLVRQVFDDCVAPLYSAEGQAEFHRFSSPEAIRERHLKGGESLLAEQEGTLIGVLEMRDRQHICLFFVLRSFQQSGVGGRLMRRAVEVLRERNPSLTRITVNSSPNAVEAYCRLGFLVKGPEAVAKGIRYVPMALDLAPLGTAA